MPKLDDGMELKTASITLPYEETNGCGFVISGKPSLISMTTKVCSHSQNCDVMTLYAL